MQPIYSPDNPQYKSYQLNNFRDIPQMQGLSEELKFEIEVVGNVLPFKVNNYVISELIDWSKVPNDPIYALTFPQKDMLLPEHYEEMAALLKSGADKDTRHVLSVACGDGGGAQRRGTSKPSRVCVPRR